jgi:Ca2+-binding EF-hand superfamily protein
MSSRQTAALTEAFTRLDKTKKGRLAIENFELIIRGALGYTPTENWLKQAAQDRSDFTMDDVGEILHSTHPLPPRYTSEDVYSALKEFEDPKNAGSITEKSLRYVLCGTGEPLGELWVNELIQSLPKDETTGNIRIVDFLKYDF